MMHQKVSVNDCAENQAIVLKSLIIKKHSIHNETFHFWSEFSLKDEMTHYNVCIIGVV